MLGDGYKTLFIYSEGVEINVEASILTINVCMI